jgi:hypothetical protein
MLFVLFILALTIFFCLLMERLAEPGTQRPLFHRASLLVATPVGLFFLSIFMLSCRVLFSSALTLIMCLIIIIANNVKVRTVREPLVFSDFALVKQVIGHPRLYLSYVGPAKLLAVGSAGVAAVFVALTLEQPVFVRSGPMDFVPMTTFFFVASYLIYAIVWGPLHRYFIRLLDCFGPSTNIEEDVNKLGLISCLILYFFLSQDDIEEGCSSSASSKELPQTIKSCSDMPDVVVVQNESFFDARTVMSEKVDGFLAAYDRTCKEALYKGRLEVPAWGANTHRTEYAFLTGAPLQTLGVHQYNPFLRVGLRPQWTLASFLKEQGYKTVCVHPYHKSFFDRDRVYPLLGFDEFLDIADFEGAERCGPYVSDMAVAAKVREVLTNSSGQPVFVFVITMENHGQWENHGINIDDEIRAAAAGSGAFACYLQHLTNADRMIEALVEVLQARERGSLFCLFGDHQPSFPDEFSAISHEDMRTDYFIWKKGCAGKVTTDTEVHSLGRLLLDALYIKDEEPVEARTAVGAH